MAYIPSECSIQEYENQIYSGESKHRLYIKHGSTVIGTNGDENASPFASKLTWTRRILDNGKKSFSLDNFVSQEIELELHDYVINNLNEEIEIKIGTYIPSIDDYVYVPLGIYKIQDKPTNDKDKTTYKLRDRSVNFDFNYNAKDLIENNSGKATKGQILQDICQKANVKFVGNENFIGYNDPIGIYDSTISARVYVSYIAEQTGCIATIDRNGDLIFVQISEDLDKKALPYNLLESYTVGEKYQIGKIEYESGVIKYEQTPFANIDGEEVNIDNAIKSGFKELTVFGESKQTIREGKNLFNINGNVNESVEGNDYGTILVEDGVLTAYNDNHSRSVGQIINVPVGTTVTFSAEVVSHGTGQAMLTILQGYSESKINSSHSSALSAVGERFEVTTTISDITKIVFFCPSTDGGTGAQFKNIQVEINDHMTEYEDYGKTPSPDFASEVETIKNDIQINVNNGLNIGNEKYEENTSTINLADNELCSIGDVKDELIIKDGKATITKRIGKVIFDGSESWGAMYFGGELGFYYKLENGKGGNVLTNYFAQSVDDGFPNYNSVLYKPNKTIIFRMQQDNTFATTSEFKNWLSNHNTTFYYELETPQQIDLGEVETPMLYEGNNNITNNYNSLMELKYSIKSEGGATLYLSSANPYINSQETLDQIFPKINNFYLYSLEISRILGNPTIDVYDIITIDNTNELGETTSYRTLAQGVLTFSGTMTQNFETIIEYEESQSNVSLNGEQVFKKTIKSQVDNVEAKLTTTIEKVETTEKGLVSLQNRFTQSIEGLENILSSAGGNNYVRDSMGALNDGSWTNIDTILDTFTRTYAVGQSAIMLNKTTPNNVEEEGRAIKQKINCKNGTYTLSFDYYKLIELATCKIIINENEYDLTQYNELTKFKETFSVLTSEVNIEFVSDTNNACYILNLILNDGVDVLNWSQNTNETITDTVKIGKGIQVESNLANTLWRADADGSRVFNKTTGAIVREDTARGTITNELESKGTSKINGLLVLKTNNQIWLSGV